jgi:flagellar hook protein FlgE
MTVQANLDSGSTTPTLPWDPQNPAATSNFSTSMEVYDSLGNAHSVDVYMRETGANTWDYHVLANGGEVKGGTPGQNFEFAAGTLSYNSSGALQTNTLNSGGTVSFNGATPNQAITMNFGTPISTGGTGTDGITQYGSPSNVTAQSQDGYSSGSITSIKVDSDGTVNGVYTNGQTLAIAQLAIAKFNDNDGLGQAGNGLWTQTRDSGNPAIGAAGAGGRASVVAGALEQSNVDISTQFVDLIAHQRAFEADSKTITTADQMLQDVMQLKQ